MDGMRIFIIICSGIFGLIVGSFLNVCIYRIPRKISINGNHGRSMCTACGSTLRWYDLIPFFSYVFLGGKCRKCKEKISIRYPMVEFLNMILWIFVGCTLEWGGKYVIYCLFLSLLIVLALIDYDTQEIPYAFEIIIIVLGIASLFMDGFPSIKERLIGCIVISIPMVVLTLLFNGFGGGDIQFMATTGFLFGWKVNVMAMLIGTILAGIFSIFVLAKRRKKVEKKENSAETKEDKEQMQIPFGPFLAVGMAIAIFYADAIIQSYLGLF
jgi:leader peptidase (prepilin peptidase)/N-methyltransferase